MPRPLATRFRVLASLGLAALLATTFVAPADAAKPPARPANRPPADPPLFPGPVPTFAPLESVPHPVDAGFAQTADDHPRLAVVLVGQPVEFGKQLTKALADTQRFEILDKAPPTLVSARPKLAPGITVAQCRALRKQTGVDRVVVCDVKNPSGEIRVNARLVWLDSGEVSRDLALFGKNSAVNTLAMALALYVRRATPLRCQVEAIGDDGVVLDLGNANGIKEGGRFRLVRYRNNVQPLPVGTLRITKVDPFTATAELEDAAKGLSAAPGDVAIEETSELALN